MRLLRFDEVQLELEVDPVQKGALEKIAEQGRGERPDFSSFRDMSDEERREFFTKMQKEAEERNKKMKELLEEVLAPPQLGRLEQLVVQYRGLQALSDPNVIAKLKITKSQQEKMQEVRESAGGKMREIFGLGDREKIQEAMGKMREQTEKEILDTLTSDQKKDFEAMKGKPFEFPEEARGGFGGRGGPGGFGGGRGGRGGDGGARGPGRGGRGGDGERGGRRERPPADDA